MGKRTQHLSGEQIARIISEWDQMSVPDFSKEFDVSAHIIRNCVYRIRILYPDKCPKKPRRRLDEFIHSAMRILGEDKAPDRESQVPVD